MGRAWKFGDNVDTDVIIPTQYSTTKDLELIADHAMEPVAPNFADEVEQGDVIVGGSNFGCGSSRETAVWAFTENGVDAIIAESVARIFFRNAINNGLPVYISPDAAADIEDGDEITISPEEGSVENGTKSKTYRIEQHPPFIQEILDIGGLTPFREKLKE